jgi:hypothetical protein
MKTSVRCSLIGFCVIVIMIIAYTAYSSYTIRHCIIDKTKMTQYIDENGTRHYIERVQ